MKIVTLYLILGLVNIGGPDMDDGNVPILIKKYHINETSCINNMPNNIENLMPRLEVMYPDSTVDWHCIPVSFDPNEYVYKKPI